MNKRIDIASDLKHIKPTVGSIIDFLKSKQTEESDIFDIRLCLEEALINAIKYGNRFDENLNVSVDVSHDGNKLIIAIEDKGPGFDYQSLPDPREEENLLKGRGRGVFLIKHLMDEMRFNKKGNRITMIKYLKGKRS